MINILTSLFLAAAPKVGDTAPDFSATDTEGKSHQLSKLVEQGDVILAFFPAAFTPGWTKELKAYRSGYAELKKKNSNVLAISTDDLETLKRFKAELEAPFPFIPDPEMWLVKLYDVKMMLLSKASRVTIVVGKDRKIKMIQSGMEAISPEPVIQACESPSAKP